MSNNEFINTPLGRFRSIAFMEGVSFLILLFIAMPLKYYVGYPLPVKYTGWAHGLLFVLYVATLLQAAFVQRWSIIKVIIAFLVSFVPFGTFVLDVRLAKEAKQSREAAKIQA